MHLAGTRTTPAGEGQARSAPGERARPPPASQDGTLSRLNTISLGGKVEK